MKQKGIKTRSVKPVWDKRPMKRRCVDGRKVTISFRWKIIKTVSQRKNERDLTINTSPKYAKSNIRAQREVRNVANMMEFNCAFILQ